MWGERGREKGCHQNAPWFSLISELDIESLLFD